jgi:Na+/H+ antiporter NhaD/arsenite permease-like protein
MNITDQINQSISSFSEQFVFLYVSGIVFFFYLRSRKMRNVYKDIKNYSKHRSIDRKIKLKGGLVVFVLAYWLLVVYKPVVIIAHTSEFAKLMDVVVMAVLYFAFFTMGGQTGYWLSDDDDFSNSN